MAKIQEEIDKLGGVENMSQIVLESFESSIGTSKEQLMQIEKMKTSHLGVRREKYNRKYDEDNNLPKYIKAQRNSGIITGYVITKFPIGTEKTEYIKDKYFLVLIIGILNFLFISWYGHEGFTVLFSTAIILSNLYTKETWKNIFGLLGLSLVALAVGLAAVSAFLPTLLILGAVLPSITSALGIGGGSSETISSDTKKSDPLLEEIRGLRADIKAQPINVVLNNKIVGEINRASRASNSYVNK